MFLSFSCAIIYILMFYQCVIFILIEYYGSFLFQLYFMNERKKYICVHWTKKWINKKYYNNIFIILHYWLYKLYYINII